MPAVTGGASPVRPGARDWPAEPGYADPPDLAVPRRWRFGRRRTPDASILLSKGQILLLMLALAGLGYAAYHQPRLTLTVLIAASMGFYTASAVFKLVITLAGRGYDAPRYLHLHLGWAELPRYAVLLPVHKEANMLPDLVAQVDNLIYPREQLCALLLIEHDDLETLAAARELDIPFYRGLYRRSVQGHLRALVVPPGGPKTKPNALNAAMGLVVQEGCEFVTIFDAEDRPEPDQLLKAVGTFRAAPPGLACLQAELAFWNDNTNWVTALYWVGYKVHFTRFMPGLAQLGLPIPLGGTSNHFRVSALRDVALRPSGHVWDPYNLTEDADLGVRLAVGGYHVGVLRSTTMEEAPASIKVVDKQQRRWKAGYLQTGLVHTRRPLRSMWRLGPARWLCFNFLVLSVPVSFLLNPLYLALTVTYFVTRDPAINQFFPTGIYYLSLALMLAGNLGLLYELLHTCLSEAEGARGRFSLAGYMLMAQFLWLWMSRSTYIALFELLTGRRGWHKTPHGHEQSSQQELEDPGQAIPIGYTEPPIRYADGAQ